MADGHAEHRRRLPTFVVRPLQVRVDCRAMRNRRTYPTHFADSHVACSRPAPPAAGLSCTRGGRGGRLDEPRGFEELLRAYRVAAGLTHEALAAKADLSVRGIGDLERGTR